MTGDRPVLVCGSRSFSYEAADAVRSTPGFEVVGFVENEDRDLCGEPHDGVPLHWVDEIPESADEAEFVVALSTTTRDRFSGRMEELGHHAATVVHPAAVVSGTSSVGAGSLVMPGAVIGAHGSIGRHTILSRGVLVGHHAKIGDHVTALPGANIAGAGEIGDKVFIGMGAIVIDGLTIGAGSLIAAGAVVTRDVPPRTQVMGIPARIVKQGIDPR